MIADLKPYAEYKESGLPWLGQVPGHWDVKRLKNWVAVNASTLSESTPNDYEFEYLDIGSVGTGRLSKSPARIRFGGAPSRARRVLRAGDTIVSTVRTYLKAVVTVGELDEPLIASTGFAVLTPRGDSVPRCLGYVAQSEYFTNQVTGDSIGIAYPAISETKLSNILVTLPPPDEQAAIVRFLDWANGRLERAIRAKRKVIALLGEQKQAIIHRAVTRGLDPSVPLKPSGIPWLGDIPQHWEVVRNMALFAHRVEAGRAGFPVLQISLRSGITAEELDQFGRPKRLIADATKYKLIHKGDVAYNTMRMWQGAVGVSPCDGLVSPAYVVLRPRCDTCPEFYDFIFHTEVYKQEVNRQSTGIVSDRNRLYWDSFKQMPNIHLPRDEQAEVVTFILSETSSLNTAISRLEREIELLREYRTRLVADVVTGKLDVREAALRLPDEAPPDADASDEDTVP